MVGNTVVDALLYTRDRVASGYRLIEPALAALPTDKKLVLATTHRHENIGDPIRYVPRALRTLGEREAEDVIDETRPSQSDVRSPTAET